MSGIRAGILLVTAASSAFSQIGTTTLPTPFGPLDFTVMGARPAGSLLFFEAALKNRSSVEIASATIRLTFLDQSGRDMMPCQLLASDFHGCELRFSGIAPGESKPPDWKEISIIRGAAKGQILKSAAPSLKEFRYTPAYTFENASQPSPSVDVIASASSAGVGLSIQNRTEDAIEILWDQSSFIDQNGESERIVHSGIKYSDASKPQPNSVIPPGAKLTDEIVPANHIVFKLNREAWTIDPIFPANLESSERPNLSLIDGKPIRVFLRMMVGAKRLDYTVKLVVHVPKTQASPSPTPGTTTGP